MKMRHHCLLSLGVILLLVLCFSCAHKRMMKEGLKYEENGMYEYAVSSYATALTKKPDYVDARIALLRSATIYASNLEEKVDNAYVSKNDNEVVKNYKLLTNLKSLVAVYGLDIVIQERTEGQYSDSKNRFLNDSYALGQKAISEEHYKDAVSYLNAVISVDPDYKDSKELLIMARCEPLYRAAITDYSNGKYRSAYNYFLAINKIDASYKDVSQLQKDAVKLGIRLLAFETIKNEQRYPKFCARLKNETRLAVNNKKDPFLQIVELAENNQLLDAQKRLMAANSEFNSSNLIPVNAIISSQVELKGNTTALQTKKCKGYLKQVDKEKKVSYKKVYYYEYSRKREVSVSYSFVILETPSGKQLTSGTLTPKKVDQIHYIYYDGKNEGNLVPGSWDQQGAFNSSKDVIRTDIISTSRLKSLITNKHTLIDAAEMEAQLASDLAVEVTRYVVNLAPKQ